jgi:hypothetical protein
MRVNEDNRRFKTVSRIFFAWQGEKEENWLIEMSKQGWHLDNTGFLTYVFRKGESKDIIYRLDFKIIRSGTIDDYITLFEDSGWEFVSKMGPWWYYFRTEAKKGESQELYSDNTSKIRMYNSLRWLLIILCAPIVYNLLNLYGRIIRVVEGGIMDDIPAQALIINFAFPLAIFLTLVLCLMIYGIIRISIVIKRLRSNIRE